MFWVDTHKITNTIAFICSCLEVQFLKRAVDRLSLCAALEGPGLLVLSPGAPTTEGPSFCLAARDRLGPPELPGLK